MNFLTVEECENVESAIYELRELWQAHSRGHLETFYTLGNASYMIDGSRTSEATYIDDASRMNSILLGKFGWLYERLSIVLTKKLTGPTQYAPKQVAVPGFHIFPTERGKLYAAGGMHLDVQFHFLNWDGFPEITFNDPISFTLAISLPEVGGGLNVCSVPTEELLRMPAERRTAILQEHTRFYRYTIGTLFIQRGLVFHEVAPRKNVTTDHARITLQGHGLQYKSGWLLYW